MVIITGMVQGKRHKDRYNIYVDDEFWGVLLDETIIKNGLHSGMEIDNLELVKIVEENNMQLAKTELFGYLSKMMKSEKEARNYLYGKGYTKPIIANAIAKAREYKLLDDTIYAKAYVNTYKANKGSKKLRYELENKGIGADIIESCIANMDYDEELENCKNIVEKFVNRYEKIDYKTLMKLKRKLLASGYSYDMINRATCDIELSKDEEIDE